jgi:hypothetical protein
MKWGPLLQFTARLEMCTVAMEACRGAHAGSLANHRALACELGHHGNGRFLLLLDERADEEAVFTRPCGIGRAASTNPRDVRAPSP